MNRYSVTIRTVRDDRYIVTTPAKLEELEEHDIYVVDAEWHEASHETISQDIIDVRPAKRITLEPKP